MKGKKRRFLQADHLILQAMALAGVVYILIFYYGPMYGIVLAFKEYDFGAGILGSPWVGLANFAELWADFEIPMIIRNTLSISILKLLICFPAPIIFALLLNEIQPQRFKKAVQTASYFPHFISWVVVSLILNFWLSGDYGMINDLLMRLGLITQPIDVLSDPDAFYGLAAFSELWKETGWSAIIYIAAISGIDPSFYEAATVDGASRIHKIIYITLPNLTGTIAIMFMLSFSGLLTGGGGAFDQSFFLGNTLNHDTSVILSTYVLNTGIQFGRFSFATAVGLLNSVVSTLLLLLSNGLSKRFLRRSLFDIGE